MDLIYKRYASPFSFLDTFIAKNEFAECVDFLYEKSQEDKWWQMYLATLPLNDKSYQDWKKEMQGTSLSKNDSSDLTKEEVDTIVEKSKDILSGFKPPQ